MLALTPPVRVEELFPRCMHLERAGVPGARNPPEPVCRRSSRGKSWFRSSRCGLFSKVSWWISRETENMETVAACAAWSGDEASSFGSRQSIYGWGEPRGHLAQGPRAKRHWPIVELPLRRAAGSSTLSDRKWKCSPGKMPVRPWKTNHFTAEAQSAKRIECLKIDETEPAWNNLHPIRHSPPRKVAVSSPSGRVIAAWACFWPVAVWRMESCDIRSRYKIRIKQKQGCGPLKGQYPSRFHSNKSRKHPFHSDDAF